MVAWDKIDESFGFDWALKMNTIFKELIGAGNHSPLINYTSLGKEALLAIPTPDHFLPLLYSLGLQDKNEDVLFFNDKPMAGSLTMTSVKLG